MTDKIMGILALALLAYCWGCTNRNLTGPADIWRDVRAGHDQYGWQGWTGVWTDVIGGHRHRRRRSDTVDTPDGAAATMSMSNVHPGEDESDRVLAGGAAIIGPPHRPWVGTPTDELPAETADDGREDDEPAKNTVAERRAWVAARLQPDDSLGLSLMEIYAMGAEVFECAEKTIMRDRESLIARKGAR